MYLQIGNVKIFAAGQKATNIYSIYEDKWEEKNAHCIHVLVKTKVKCKLIQLFKSETAKIHSFIQK